MKFLPENRKTVWLVSLTKNKRGESAALLFIISLSSLFHRFKKKKKHYLFLSLNYTEKKGKNTVISLMITFLGAIDLGLLPS